MEHFHVGGSPSKPLGTEVSLLVACIIVALERKLRETFPELNTPLHHTSVEHKTHLRERLSADSPLFAFMAIISFCMVTFKHSNR